MGTLLRQIQQIGQFSHNGNFVRMIKNHSIALTILRVTRIFRLQNPHMTDSLQRSRQIQRVTLAAIGTNVTLTIGQIAIGLFANAFSLVADAVHTLTDLITDLLVLVAGRKGALPADRDHPYGHGRIETVVSLTLGIALILVGLGFLWASGMRLQNMHSAAKLHPAALYMAVITLVIKELLFRYTLAAGRRLQAPLLEANAWHARSDAASSLVVAIGIAGSLAGYPFLEPMAAAVVGFLVASMGFKLAWRAVRELIDTGLSEEQIARLRATILETPGVVDLHDLRTRRMANRVLCDTHVLVHPYSTASEGHHIANAVARRIPQAHPEIRDILVHIDVENDSDEALSANDNLPSRHEATQTVRTLLNRELPAEAHVQLHYLHGAVEINVFLPEAFWMDIDAGALKNRTAALLAASPCYRSVDFFTRKAP